jgi:hypothetical protein
MTKYEIAFRIIAGIEPFTPDMYKMFTGYDPPARDEEKSVFDHIELCNKTLKQNACHYLAESLLRHTHF